jgi:hypothetical protein
MPDDIIFEILQWIHPCIYLIISKNLFRPWSKPDKEKLTISLLIALNNTSTFEEFHSVVLSYRFRDTLGIELARKGNLSTLQWFHSRKITWEDYLLSTLAGRGELESLKWAISNQVTKKLKNCKITASMQSILVAAACYGRENILKWALDLGYFDKEFFIFVVQSAASFDQLKIIIWMINNYPSARKLMEKLDFYICHIAATRNNIQALEWFKNNFPNTFLKEKVQTGFTCILKAADHGNLRMLEWLKGNDFPFEFDRKKISSAAVSKHDNSLEVLQYVMRSCNCPWPDDIYDKALKYGRLDILLWAVSNGYPWNPNPNDILFAVACSRLATATPDILNWIADQDFVFEDAEDCIHCAVVMKNFNFIRWAKSILLPNFWHDSIIKKAAAAGNLPALIWAAEIHPESFTSALLGILVQNATSGGHMNVLNWILEKYGIFKTAFLNRRLCDIAAEKGFVEILQWAVANGCEWDRSHCCGLAILHQRLKVLIWIKFKADVYSHYTSPYWYGESVWCGKNVLFRLIELIREEGDFRQWLILNIGSEEGVYFDETRACWRTIDNDNTDKSFLDKRRGIIRKL